ncbi:hypothetical protein JCM19379_29110 [Methyloparacoccus murrellii]
MNGTRFGLVAAGERVNAVRAAIRADARLVIAVVEALRERGTVAESMGEIADAVVDAMQASLAEPSPGVHRKAAAVVNRFRGRLEQVADTQRQDAERHRLAAKAGHARRNEQARAFLARWVADNRLRFPSANAAGQWVARQGYPELSELSEITIIRWLRKAGYSDRSTVKKP